MNQDTGMPIFLYALFVVFNDNTSYQLHTNNFILYIISVVLDMYEFAHKGNNYAY